MKKLTILALLSLTFSLNSLACSCQEMQGNAQEFLKNASSVFLGIALEDSTETGNVDEYGQIEMKTKFKVVKNFKAANSSEAIVYSEKGDGANCGVHFEAKKGTVLLFTYMEEGKLSTGSCSVTGIDYSNYSSEILLELL